MLYAGTNAGVIEVWKDDEYVITLIDHDEDEPYSIKSLAYGKGLLYSANYNGIRVWKDNVLISKLTEHVGMVNCLLYNDGLLYSGGADNTVKIWEDNKCIATLDHDYKVNCLTYGDGTLYTGDNNGTITLWKDNKRVDTIRCDYTTIAGPVYHLSYGCGKLHAITSNGPIDDDDFCPGGYLIHSWFDSLLIMTLHGGHNNMACIACNDMLYVSDSEGRIDEYEVENFKTYKRLSWGGSMVNAFAYNDGVLYSGHANGTIKVWREVGLLTKAALK
tara:strand:- start:12151 stop:12972 length:822 start_codon:yes stop_codon:yes gene_type:complete